MPTRPIVSIFIPTYNRSEVLADTLEHLSQLGRIDEAEVLVCDDASDRDDTPQLGLRFPDMTFLREPVNRGQSHARNRMMQAAHSDILVGLDDDSWFLQPDALDRIVDTFRMHPTAGLLAFRIIWADGRACPSVRSDRPQPARTFIGCGFAIRKCVADAVGGFVDRLRRQGEEQELSLRVLDAGYDILDVSDIDVYHLETDAGRDHPAHHALALRNELLTLVLRYPLRYGLWAWPKTVASHAVFCLRKHWFRAFGRGLGQFFRYAAWALRQRRPVRAATIRRFRRLGHRKAIRMVNDSSVGPRHAVGSACARRAARTSVSN